jgi:hypothetical protein
MGRIYGTAKSAKMPGHMDATLAERSLDILVAMNGATRAAAFHLDGTGRLKLFVSRRIDQDVLDAATAICATRRGDLEAGRLVVLKSGAAMIPVRSEGGLLGIVYLEKLDETLCPPDDRARLAASIAADMKTPASGAGTLWASVLEETSLADMAREQLVTLLERHEWNIARVGRALGVTRQTIYLRMTRYGIERRRFSKEQKARGHA